MRYGKSADISPGRLKKVLYMSELYGKTRKGLAQSLIIFKWLNSAAKTTTYSSKSIGGVNAFDVNVRSTCASLPFGREGLAKFCGIMDLHLY